MNPAKLFDQQIDTVQLAPGEFLSREGDKADKMYVLLEGEMDIRLGDNVVDTAREGALVGEMALIDDKSACCQRCCEVCLPTGTNRQAAIWFSGSAAPAFRDACDKNDG
jgi:CRP-like cAMP-binding protein